MLELGGLLKPGPASLLPKGMESFQNSLMCHQDFQLLSIPKTHQEALLQCADRGFMRSEEGPKVRIAEDSQVILMPLEGFAPWTTALRIKGLEVGFSACRISRAHNQPQFAF